MLERAFTGAIKASGCEPSQMEQLAVRSRPVLRAYLEREAASDATPVGVELGFGVDVPVGENEPPIRFVGYVDRIDRRPDGTIELLDHKTGRSRSQAEVDRDDQLTAYAFACARGGLRDPSSGEPFPAPARLGLHFAESGLTVWTSRAREELVAFGERLGETVGRIRRREFGTRPGTACRWCELPRDLSGRGLGPERSLSGLRGLRLRAFLGRCLAL